MNQTNSNEAGKVIAYIIVGWVLAILIFGSAFDFIQKFAQR